MSIDALFYRRPDETAADWHARLAALDPVCLSCLQRERRKIWLEMAYGALRKERRVRKRPRHSH